MSDKCLNSHSRIYLFLIFFFLLRLTYVFFFGWQDLKDDAISYNTYALAIVNQADWLANPSFQGDYRPPGYPVFLSVIYSVFGVENFFAVYLFQAIISTLTVYYVFKLSASMFGEKKAFLALVWAGFYFFYIRYDGMILRETLIFFLVIFSFFHLWVFLNRKEPSHCVKNPNLWGFLIAFTVLLHTDARYLFYIPFLVILFVIYCDFWIGIKTYSWVLAMLILLLVPWTIRNYIAYDGIVLINTRTLDARQKNISIRLNTLSAKPLTYIVGEDYPSEEERALIKEGKNPNNRSPEEVALIKKDVYAPASFIGRKLYQMKEMWLPFRFWSDYAPSCLGLPTAKFQKSWSLRHNLVSIVFYGTLIPFMFCGLFYLFQTGNKAVWLLLFPIFVHALLHFLMFGIDRYRMPVDAFVIILGCYGVVVAYEFIRTRHVSCLNHSSKTIC